jgi:hypothetical protein
MRTLVRIAAASVLAAGSAVALAGGGATAGGPYPGTIDTTCEAEALNNPEVGDAARARFRVTTDGNGGASGRVTFTYERRTNDNVVAEYSRSYDGPGWTDYRFQDLPRGKYDVRVNFNSQPADSVYKNCSTSYDQRVKPD